ncbi:MAG: alpha/beta hydrolase [Meiothermus sp.]|nr:alpha/beta hydrolase [Meiothermus sp.]
MKARGFLLAGLVALFGLGSYLAWDISRLQSGMVRPSGQARQAAEARLAQLPNYPSIRSYASFAVESDGIEIRVWAAEENHPEAMLLVHGAGGGAWVWEALMPRLRQQFNVYALSWRGHFDSGEAEEGNLELYIRDTSAVLRAIRQRNPGLERIHLIGHSWGGPVAIGTALANPNTVASLTLLAPVLPLAYTPAQKFFYPNVIRPIVRRVLQAGRAGDSFKGMFLASSQMQRYLEAHASKPYSVEKPGLLADDGFLPERQALLVRNNVELIRLRIPLHLALARYDNVVPPPRMRAWAVAWNSPVEEFESGHYLMLDAAYPEVADWLLQRLARPILVAR